MKNINSCFITIISQLINNLCMLHCFVLQLKQKKIREKLHATLHYCLFFAIHFQDFFLDFSGGLDSTNNKNLEITEHPVYSIFKKCSILILVALF